MKLYILVADHDDKTHWKIGGGSSTKEAARVYDSRAKAEMGIKRISLGYEKFSRKDLRIVEFDV